jgi:hypothetical protein
MADLNRWTRTLERRTLEGLAAEVQALKTMAWGNDRGDMDMRRAYVRVLQLIDAKLLALREADERADSRSSDDIDEGLKA